MQSEFGTAGAGLLQLPDSGIGDERPTRFHFFDPNYGQFGMATQEEFVDRLWHFVQPQGVEDDTTMPTYGDVWAYVRHAENGGQASRGAENMRGLFRTATSSAGAAIREEDSELGELGRHGTKLQDLPFVPAGAAVLPDVNGEDGRR